MDSQLTSDWVNYAAASLQTRIDDTGQSTTNVLNAVQAIASELDDTQDLEPLLEIKNEQQETSTVLEMLRDLLEHLDTQSSLAQLIQPLFFALQFEDRTRQKLESIIGVLTVWSECREDDQISDEALAEKLKQHSISMEQLTILEKYFPDHIQAGEASESVDLF